MSREPRMRDGGGAYGAGSNVSSRLRNNSQPYPSAPYRAPPGRGGGAPSTGLVVATSQASSLSTSQSPPSQLATSQNNTNPTGPPRLTIHNFAIFNARAKKLPPDANVKAALHTKLWQFPERVCFACAKCRRDNVQSDSVAIDVHSRVILCTACFTRIIRPRIYRPSRVVPFPSLLSWLNYQPARAMQVNEDVMERPAEAVAPSGQRMAVPLMAGGDRPTQLHRLPANAMNVVPQTGGGNNNYANSSNNRGRGGGRPTYAHRNNAGGGRNAHASAYSGNNNTNNSYNNSGSKAGDATMDVSGERCHPCIRVWGRCVHGETCLFRNAPFDLCIAYLMGICRPQELQQQPPMRYGGRCGGGGRGGRGRGPCRLLNQNIYDLPPVNDPAPQVRHASHMVDDNSIWARWIQRQRSSPNSAAWQLWNNGPCEGLLNAFVPLTSEVPVKEGDLGATLRTAPVVTATDAQEEDEGQEMNSTDALHGAHNASDEPVGGESSNGNRADDEYDGEQASALRVVPEVDEYQHKQQRLLGDEDADPMEYNGAQARDQNEWRETTQLNFTDIMSALQQITKAKGNDCNDANTIDNHEEDEEDEEQDRNDKI